MKKLLLLFILTNVILTTTFAQKFAYVDTDYILNKIDTYAEKLKWAQEENDNKWQTIGVYVWPNPVIFDTYQEEVDHMKAWYETRMDWLESALEDL